MPINPEPIRSENSRSLETKRDRREVDFLITDPMYQFEDMVMDEKLEEAIVDAMSVFQYREKIFDEWNLSKVIKKPLNLCINFYGAPGTGKTMAANAVAHRLNMRMLKVNYADIESKYVGETSKNIVKLFKEAELRNALILFDEADALLSKRVTEMSSATDVSVNQTRSVLLTMLDDFNGMVIFTTNFISNYDSAFMRRIPYHIKFELPNEKMRIQLFKHYLIDTIPNNIDIHYLAKKYDGISASDIANATLVSAIKTARINGDILQQNDYEDALKSIITSRKDNQGKAIQIETREVSEAYAVEQIDKTGGIIL